MRDRREELIEDILRSATLLGRADQLQFHRLVDLLASSPSYAVDHALTPLREGGVSFLASRRDFQEFMHEAIRFLEQQQYGCA